MVNALALRQLFFILLEDSKFFSPLVTSRCLFGGGGGGGVFSSFCINGFFPHEYQLGNFHATTNTFKLAVIKTYYCHEHVIEKPEHSFICKLM